MGQRNHGRQGLLEGRARYLHRRLSLPSSCLLSQGVDRWFRPESVLPVLSQPGGASQSWGDSPGGHLPPARASQLPLPWQQLDSSSQGKAPSGSAQHSQTPGRGHGGRRPCRGVSRGPGSGGDQGREPGSREGGRKDRDGGEGAGREDQTQRGRDEDREGGRRTQRRETWMREKQPDGDRKEGKREEGEGSRKE